MPACSTFFWLGGDVIDLLGGGEKSLARRRFVRIGEIGVIDCVPGLIATDRFSLLKRQFEQANVRSAASGGSPPISDIQVLAAACPEWRTLANRVCLKDVGFRDSRIGAERRQLGRKVAGKRNANCRDKHKFRMKLRFRSQQGVIQNEMPTDHFMDRRLGLRIRITLASAVGTWTELARTRVERSDGLSSDRITITNYER